MASSNDASIVDKAKSARTAAHEHDLQQQISSLQKDLKSIAETLTRLGGDKINDTSDAAKSEYSHLRHQGQQAIDEVQAQAGQFEKQLKDTIRNKPLTSLAGAVGIGFVLALLSRQ